MAKGTTHMVVGALLALCVSFCMQNYFEFRLPVTWFFLCLCCAIAGSIFPDIDTKSKGQKFFYLAIAFIYSLLAFYKYYSIAIVLGLISFVPLIVSHRSLLHSLWFIMIIVGSVYYGALIVFPSYGQLILISSLFFMLGVISHLVLDFGVS